MELIITLLVSLGVNLAMFVPAFIFQTDKLTDISYAVTFVTLAVFGLFYGEMSLLKIVYVAAVGLWAIRLGSYLLIRIQKIGKDKRFDGMREYFFKFIRFWILQAITVWVVMIPGTYFLNGAVSENLVWPIVGLAVFLLGLAAETVADMQKYRFINNSENNGKWIQSGLWSISRHPNYLGEITVWIGLYLFVMPSLVGSAVWIGLIGPLFIAGMIGFVSGIPMLEKGADKRWGDNPEYQKYKENTGILLPKIF